MEISEQDADDEGEVRASDEEISGNAVEDDSEVNSPVEQAADVEISGQDADDVSEVEVRPTDEEVPGNTVEEDSEVKENTDIDTDVQVENQNQ